MSAVILRGNISPEDDSWIFTAILPRTRRPNMGKHISFSPNDIKLDMTLFPANRILQSDDPSKFILASFEKLRFPDTPFSVTKEYMIRLFRAGLYLNGVQYRFYGHSNSQLRSRSCFLREATSDEELDTRIYRLGDFQSIKNAAKRAKRIGLLFSEAKLDWVLDPSGTKDIGDIVANGENFSDGCGLISRTFAIQLSRHKGIIFRGLRYTPSIYQIRYRGYKGVLMIHPELQTEHVHFRKSQRKFAATENNTFSVVDYSVPYAFGRLNNDVVVLLASLGVPVDRFIAKQKAYHELIQRASEDWEAAFNLLSATGRYHLTERLLLDGLDSAPIQREIRALQNSELAAFRKNDRPRVRTLVPMSRLLFGVCDPYGVLREGEVHVRVFAPRKGATTLTNVDVLVVRNPCLHPGDCLKLRAVHHPRLSHLVDCIVFATQGRRAAPSMSSGGDLDGDKFTVLWDPDLVPPKIAESYTYPAPKEHISNQIAREDLAKHFASYNSIALGRITSLHQKWVRLSPKGAMSEECQELNALHSFAVDGASVKIPDRLTKLPVIEENPDAPYVLDALHREAEQFAGGFQQANLDALRTSVANAEEAENMIVRLLSTEKQAVSEFELIMSAAALARRYDLDLRRHLAHVDFGALSTAEKFALSSLIGLTPEQDPYVWNSLIRSEILQPADLEQRELNGPLHLQRLYCSSVQGRAAFFEYLKEAIQQYHRRLIIMKTDDRFSVGIFLRGEIQWDEEPDINDNVLVCSFMPNSSTRSATYARGTKGYRLHCGENVMQLFNDQRANSFIFVTRPPSQSGADIVTSIALHKISAHVQKQCGRVHRTPVVSIEIHVVSNRDRVSHQTFDLRFEYVKTEEYLPRFDHKPRPYAPQALSGVDWSSRSAEECSVFQNTKEVADIALENASNNDLQRYMQFAIRHRAEERVFWIFDALLRRQEYPLDVAINFIEEHPPLAFSLIKKYLPVESELSDLPGRIGHASFNVIRGIIRSANQLGIAALAGLERLSSDIDQLDLPAYLELLWLASISVRAPNLAQGVFLVLHDCRAPSRARDDVQQYAHKHALAINFDRAEEAADACPCDEGGRPKRQSTAPIRARLKPIASIQQSEAPLPQDEDTPGSKIRVMAHIRVDAPTLIRIHSHVRLKVASPAEHSTLLPAIVDATVVRATRGEMLLEVQHPLPPEYADVDWNMYNAGSVATSKAMLDAVQRLAMEGVVCCGFNRIITGGETVVVQDPELVEDIALESSTLNPSQRNAVLSARPGRMTLIWGPPGTGKTTVVVQILLRFLIQDPESRILMTASTHNAVDNVLERFVAENAEKKLLSDEQILRAATESSKVHKALQKYTIDARLGGSLTDNPRLIQKAERRVKDARIVFTTCTGAGLGILRKADFETVLIDEASQITEPGALIPLVKGCRTAVLVGDHVQLRPTVRPMGKALEFDKSLFERLYTGPSYAQMSRTMLEIQYRFSEDVARFPSEAFYEGRLRSGNPREQEISAALGPSSFPWPYDEQKLVPVMFVPCTSEEDYGRSSKSNEGQVNLVKHILSLLRTPRGERDTQGHFEAVQERLHSTSIAVLTPYARQVQLLKQNLPSEAAVVSTIDGFQGRESDVVVFSTVRCNAEGDIGFVEDARRLNVAWTRPRLALIVVGDRRTLETNVLWRKALAACREVHQ